MKKDAMCTDEARRTFLCLAECSFILVMFVSTTIAVNWLPSNPYNKILMFLLSLILWIIGLFFLYQKIDLITLPSYISLPLTVMSTLIISYFILTLSLVPVTITTNSDLALHIFRISLFLLSCLMFAVYRNHNQKQYILYGVVYLLFICIEWFSESDSVMCYLADALTNANARRETIEVSLFLTFVQFFIIPVKEAMLLFIIWDVCLTVNEGAVFMNSKRVVDLLLALVFGMISLISYLYIEEWIRWPFILVGIVLAFIFAIKMFEDKGGGLSASPGMAANGAAGITELVMLNEEDHPLATWTLYGKTGLTIGRDMGENQVDVNLSSSTYASMVEVEHAVLNYSGGRWYVEDLSSKNGVSVQKSDGRKYKLSSDKPCRLSSGDIIYIALVRLLVR